MYVTDAKKSQANDLAKLIQLAGENLPFYVWQMEGDGESTPLEFGAKQIASSRHSSVYSYQNARICMEDGKLLGASLSYKLDHKPSLLGLHEYPAPVIPILMLLAKVPDAWFINALIVDEHQRHRGVGRLMTRDAEIMAIENDCSELVLVVNSANKTALALYGSLGYISRDQAPVEPYPNCEPGSYWVLLSLPLARRAYAASPKVESRHSLI